MISYADYLEAASARVPVLPPVRVGTIPSAGGDAAGRRTAVSVTAVWDTPAFTNSAMDGFAVAVTDLVDDGTGTVTLPVSGDIAAGATGRCEPGTAVRIMTGAPMPTGTDTVVPVELTDQPSAHDALHATVRLPADWPVDRHVRHRGSDVASGAELLPAGTLLDGAALAALAGAGVMSVLVRPRVRVAVIVTGDELMSLDDISLAGGTLPDGKILDSNAILVAETMRTFGVDVAFEATCGDDPAVFDTTLARAMNAGVDLIITTGGASVGAHDVARDVLGGHGVTFESVGIQPAKPQGFGVLDGVVVAALPGNPGAVHASLWMIVRPILAKFTGGDVPPPNPKRVAEGWQAKAGMRQFVPVVIDGDSIRPVIPGGVASHRVASLARADGLATVPEPVTVVEEGDLLDVTVTRFA